MKKVNAYLIITALLLIVLGVVCVMNPQEIFASMAWVAGLLILVSGFTTLFFGLRAQKYLPNAGSTMLMAVFQIIIGLILLCNTAIVAEVVVTLVFSMWVMIEGVSLGVLAFDYKKSGYDLWWIMMLLGVCSVVLGFLALRNPSDTSTFLGIMLGIGIFANGIVRIIAFTALKRIGEAVRDMKESSTAMNIDEKK